MDLTFGEIVHLEIPLYFVSTQKLNKLSPVEAKNILVKSRKLNIQNIFDFAKGWS